MITVHPDMIRLSWREFKIWANRYLPGEDAEKLYKSIGGKPDKKAPEKIEGAE